jgi:asparagine synthase (glutamine-hydrolysing)
MCGICGILSLNGAPVDPATLDEMNQALLHRGPDSGGSFVQDGVGLAARRLAIIDLEGGDQPIANEDGTIHVVQNGEIYNYRELREELERNGHRLATRSDTEVLVHLYEDHGPGFVEKLRGMFAIALWDGRARRLVLARDRFGIKPLYYRLTAESLSFASELKALLKQPGFSREIDLSALETYLAFSFIPAPLTIFRGVNKLPPGSVLTWEADRREDGGVEITSYARPRPVASGEVRNESEEELAEELLSRLRDSVRAHLIADVPVGVLLSGGLDSCTLAALASQESSAQVMTFSIGFEERRFDERERARLVAQRYGTDHHELVVRPDAVELLPTLAKVYDEPFADASAIPTFIVSKLARQHVKVALSGEGGDELFGGYDYYVGHLLARRLRAVARLSRPLVERLPSSSAKASTFDHKAKRFVRGAGLSPLQRHYAWKEVFSPEGRTDLLQDDRRGQLDPLQLLSSRYAESEGSDDLSRIMDVDLGIFLVDDMLVKTDRASMANSLEARVPFLDPVVSELALALPSRLKVRPFATKRIVRSAVSRLLPKEILQGKKQGFSIPVAGWLRGELQPVAREALSPERVRNQGFFKPETVTSMLDGHAAGRADFSRQLWALLVFSLWFDEYVGAT